MAQSAIVPPLNAPDVYRTYEQRPSTLKYMLEALLPRVPLTDAAPRVGARWLGHRVDHAQLERFSALTGLGTSDYLPITYPLTFGFPVVMAVITQRRFPLPTLKVLQTRNHVVHHRPIPSDAALDIEVGVVAQRILEKGTEVDLHTTVRTDGGLAWDSIVTFYQRGCFGKPEQPSALAKAPAVENGEDVAWALPVRDTWAFAAFTGDHNGIHRWDWYARLLGFPRALYHPSFVVSQCLSKLRAALQQPPVRLDLWFKGPVFKRSTVTMTTRATTYSRDTTFCLTMQQSLRPSIIGKLSPGPASL